ncbi:phospholipase A1-II 1-like [Gossypium australe]|uniref:Phospholipase A1 n=1 Tax=Gossypium australe TaxID=47621 RepID=A0A5B6VRF2_9ROSI|nr:phospholipase A1-II 1-like [Gossypium australe]
MSTDEGKRGLGRRDVLVAWRGAKTGTEWFNDMKFLQQTPSDLFPIAGADNVKVHGGFLSLYTGTVPDSTHSKTSAREQVLDAVKELIVNNLGGALATLTAMDIIANGYKKPTTSKVPFMVTALVVSSCRKHRVGILTGKVAFWQSNAVNEDEHETEQLTIIDGWLNKVDSSHNMDVYMHGVAIENIEDTTLVSELDYDLPLVNKYLDRVKEEYRFSPDWWVGENRKKMVE